MKNQSLFLCGGTVLGVSVIGESILFSRLNQGGIEMFLYGGLMVVFLGAAFGMMCGKSRNHAMMIGSILVASLLGVTGMISQAMIYVLTVPASLVGGSVETLSTGVMGGALFSSEAVVVSVLVASCYGVGTMMGGMFRHREEANALSA